MYYQPTTIDEALAIKTKLGRGGHFVAGGTDLVVGMRKRVLAPEHFIDLSRVAGLDELVEANGYLKIGANVTHSQLESSDITALALSTETVGGPQIRNLGTFGGQIGTASPAGDVSVALIALKAECELISPRGTRRLPLDEVFVGPGKTIVEPDEMVLAVYVPLGRRSTFYKIGKRDAVAISLVMAAASVGSAGDVAFGVGCVAPVPLRCKRAEAHLDEHGLEPEAIERAAELVGEEVSPIDDHRGGKEYRQAMAVTLAKRLLRQLSGVAAG